MSILYMIRGLPGSGKSTLAHKLTMYVFEADSFHYVDGVYQWKPENVAASHDWCRVQTRDALKNHLGNAAVANTSIRLSFMVPYFLMAEQFGYDVVVYDCWGPFKDIHDVPEATLARMRASWQPYTPEAMKQAIADASPSEEALMNIPLPSEENA